MTFDVVAERTIGHEDGYVNDPTDPGGETKWGISKRSYPHVDIKNLTRGAALVIYRQDFWDLLKMDRLPDPLAFQLFDFAFHSGIGTAVRLYQRALGVADDGHFGPVSYAASQAMSEGDQVMRLNAERLEFMTKLKNWPAASRGWARRIAANLRYGAEDTL